MARDVSNSVSKDDRWWDVYLDKIEELTAGGTGIDGARREAAEFADADACWGPAPDALPPIFTDVEHPEGIRGQEG